jgi:hypothetical protein
MQEDNRLNSGDLKNPTRTRQTGRERPTRWADGSNRPQPRQGFRLAA